MDAETMIKSMNGCAEAVDWCKGKSIKEAWASCPRGDWMLWIYSKKFPGNAKELALAKMSCAMTVAHLLSKNSSQDDMSTALKFGYGFATSEQLKSADNGTYAAGVAAANYANYAARAADEFADTAAAYAAYAAAYAAYYAAPTPADAPAAYDDAKKENMQKTADICRYYLDISSLYELEN